jgi:ferredoxin
MQAKWISKKELKKLLTAWTKHYLVYAPIDNDHELAFQMVKEPARIVVDGYSNTRYPAKSLFLPQSEVLMKYDGILHSVENTEKEKILFGIRPCDAHAMQLLEHALVDVENPDLYWKQKRESAIVISKACIAPEETCFCTAVGGSPFNTADSDVLLVEMGEDYCVYVLTEKGISLCKELPDAEDTQLQAVKKLTKKVVGRMPVLLPKQELHNALMASFETEFWKDVSQSCLGCGVCTFLCPSCFCFDIVDETVRKERVRNWDTCMFRTYSLEASGHNPRPTKVERTRQRIMHKFAYWVDLIDEIGCTGCGRCVKYCPVNIDIREIAEKALHREFEGMKK